MRVLFFLFIILPIIEMVVLIKVGGQIGALPTIALVVATAAIGVALLKRQGIATLARAQKKMAFGELPAQEMLDGIFLAVGGALLLTPGFITDALGFCCLIPGLRFWLYTMLKPLLAGTVVRTHYSASGFTSEAGQQRSAQPLNEKGGRDTIDGEYRREK